MSGNTVVTVVTAVTLAIRGTRSKIAYFLHSVNTAQRAPPPNAIPFLA